MQQKLHEKKRIYQVFGILFAITFSCCSLHAVAIDKPNIIVIMADGSLLSESSAREQVEKAGFTLRSFTRINQAE